MRIPYRNQKPRQKFVLLERPEEVLGHIAEDCPGLIFYPNIIFGPEKSYPPSPALFCDNEDIARFDPGGQRLEELFVGVGSGQGVLLTNYPGAGFDAFLSRVAPGEHYE